MLSHARERSLKAYLDSITKEDSEQICKFHEKKKLPTIVGRTEFIDWANRDLTPFFLCLLTTPPPSISDVPAYCSLAFRKGFPYLQMEHRNIAPMRFDSQALRDNSFLLHRCMLISLSSFQENDCKVDTDIDDICRCCDIDEFTVVE